MIPAKSVSDHMMNIQISDDSKKCPIFYKNDPDLIWERIGMRSCYDVLDVVFLWVESVQLIIIIEVFRIEKNI